MFVWGGERGKRAKFLSPEFNDRYKQDCLYQEEAWMIRLHSNIQDLKISKNGEPTDLFQIFNVSILSSHSPC